MAKKLYEFRIKKTGEIIRLETNNIIRVEDPTAWCMCDFTDCPRCVKCRDMSVEQFIAEGRKEGAVKTFVGLYGSAGYHTVVELIGPVRTYMGHPITFCRPAGAMGAMS